VFDSQIGSFPSSTDLSSKSKSLALTFLCLYS